MRHRRQSAATRAGLLAFRAARMGVLLRVIPVPPVLTAYLCFASTPP